MDGFTMLGLDVESSSWHEWVHFGPCNRGSFDCH
jgi:hypothetical protein